MKNLALEMQSRRPLLDFDRYTRISTDAPATSICQLPTQAQGGYFHVPAGRVMVFRYTNASSVTAANSKPTVELWRSDDSVFPSGTGLKIHRLLSTGENSSSFLTAGARGVDIWDMVEEEGYYYVRLQSSLTDVAAPAIQGTLECWLFRK